MVLSNDAKNPRTFVTAEAIQASILVFQGGFSCVL
jgi:hypothetical protein